MVCLCKCSGKYLLEKELFKYQGTCYYFLIPTQMAARNACSLLVFLTPSLAFKLVVQKDMFILKLLCFFVDRMAQLTHTNTHVIQQQRQCIAECCRRSIKTRTIPALDHGRPPAVCGVRRSPRHRLTTSDYQTFVLREKSETHRGQSHDLDGSIKTD